MIAGLLITTNLQGCEFPADGTNRPASRILRITPSGGGSFRNERMERLWNRTSSTGFHGIPCSYVPSGDGRSGSWFPSKAIVNHP
jgi:hypothetical protein